MREKLGINNSYGKIFASIDFGNVNYWFEYDENDENNKKLVDSEKLIVSLEKLSHFCGCFSNSVKFYYGLDQRRKKSIHLIKLALGFFGKTNAVTKPVQVIKHYLDESEINGSTRSVNFNKRGAYVCIPKCNFDVEICIDAIRLLA